MPPPPCGSKNNWIPPDMTENESLSEKSMHYSNSKHILFFTNGPGVLTGTNTIKLHKTARRGSGAYHLPPPTLSLN